MRSGFERKGTYDINSVMRWMESTPSQKFDGTEVLFEEIKYLVLKEKGFKCCSCPTVGTYFALERTAGYGKSKYNNWHFNLYGKNEYEHEVMMTRDHVTPSSRGGKDELENMQTMCESCNMKKGNMHMKEFEAKMQGKVHNWDIHYAKNVIQKLKDKYNMNVSISDYPDLHKTAKLNSKIVQYISTYKSYRKVNFKGTDVYVVYSSSYDNIYSVLTPEEMEAKKTEVPYWGAGREEECKKLYEEITTVIKQQFSGRPDVEDKREIGLYLSKCKYPKLAFAYFRNDADRINSITWGIVKSTLKIKNEQEANSDLSVQQSRKPDKRQHV